MAEVTLRRATMADWARLFAWRNDPSTYRYFRVRYPIGLPAHLDWLRNMLDDPQVYLYVAEIEVPRHLSLSEWKAMRHGNPQTIPRERRCIGTARLTTTALNRALAECSLTIAPRERQGGLGVATLLELMRQAARHGFSRVRAEILPENTASLRCFAAAGFQVIGCSDKLATLEWMDAESDRDGAGESRGEGEQYRERAVPHDGASVGGAEGGALHGQSGH